MSDEFDPLADLNLDDAATGANTGDTGPSDENESDAPTKKKREHVNVGVIVVSEDEEMIPLTRNSAGGTRESKYKFDDLTAPKPHPTKEGAFLYSTFFVELLEGTNPDALKRSVQSATTAENRENKEAGTGKYFETRSVIVDGVYKGTKVFRTDAAPADKAE